MLEDEHGIAVGGEFVFFADGDVVGVVDEFGSAKGACHDELGGFGMVEVGDHHVGDGEVVRREDEFVGPAVVGTDFAGDGDGALDGAHGGGADNTDFVAIVLCIHDGVASLRRDVHLFGIHAMLGKVFDFDVLKVANATMEG